MQVIGANESFEVEKAGEANEVDGADEADEAEIQRL